MSPILVEYKGKRISLMELSRMIGVSYNSVIKRYHQGKRGEDLVSPQAEPASAEYNGKTISLRELSRKTGISYQTLIRRYHNGKRGEDLVSPEKCVISVEHKGRNISLMELSRKTGVCYQTLIRRYHSGRRGDELVSSERIINYKCYEFRGKLLPMGKIASVLGADEAAVRYSYYRYGTFDYVNKKPPPRPSRARILCTIDGVDYRAPDLTRQLGVSRQAVSMHYLSKSKKDFINWVKRRLENSRKP
jgi:lambda repressor-like predicted transcriptional regulator